MEQVIGDIYTAKPGLDTLVINSNGHWYPHVIVAFSPGGRLPLHLSIVLQLIPMPEMLPMLLSLPMPLPLTSMSMDPALRLEQRKVLMGPDHLELALYPTLSTL